MPDVKPKKQSILTPAENLEVAERELDEAIKALLLARWRWNRARKTKRPRAAPRHPESCRCEGTGFLYAPGGNGSKRCTGPKAPHER